MLAAFLATPDPSGSVALVLAPWTSQEEAFDVVRRSEGRFIRFGNVPWLVVVAPAENDHHFSASARLAGALLVINPLFVGDCSQPSTATPQPEATEVLR